ncbi:FbpB family small basic protein [Alteribacter lacisalsi]|nr:FbpB family small basic protein [Alteribacter lacisalsi]
MRKRFHRTFEELVQENKTQLMNDPNALLQIDKKVDDKHAEDKRSTED